MKTKLLASFILMSLVFSMGKAQVQQGFTFQAIARDGSGNPIKNTALPVKLTIQSDSLGGTVYWQEEHSAVITNNLGLITLIVGKGSKVTGTAESFSDIDWNNGPLFIKIEIDYDGWIDMGSSRLWSVPYAMVADKANGVNPGAKLSVTSDDDQDSEPLFEVKRKDGQTVFAVYPDAVNVYVPPSGKGAKGGFAVGGFDAAKNGSQDYLRVTPDSVRVYINSNPSAKGAKGGFAVGGYDQSKGINSMYFNLSGSSDVNTVESSPQVLWYPNKNAFLAGNVHIGHIDSVGSYSTALGYQSRAIGNYSQAFGYKATAFGDFSTSIGKKSIAGVYKSKHNAFALGNGTQALGEDSYAFGSGAKATGVRSFAFGSVSIDSLGNALTTPTEASGDYSTAIGMGALASNFGSLAFGASSSSSGYAAAAFGFYSSATNYYGVAIGYYANSTGYYGHAFGLKARASGTGTLALGMYANSIGNYSAAVGYSAVSNGSYSIGLGYRSNAIGDYSASLGRSAISNGPSSVAIGYSAQTAVSGTGAGAFGYGSVANGQYSVAVGPTATTGSSANYAGSFGYSADALGPNSVAIGYNAQTASTATSAGSFGYNASASGATSVAIGPGATTGVDGTNAGSFGYGAAANGANSVAVGYGAITSGPDASAFGKSASASGSTSMALGTNSIASGTNSVSIGYSSDATNTYSVAMGYNAQSTGQYATAVGYNSQANGSKSISIGAYYNYTYYRFTYDPITHRFIFRPYTVTKNNVSNGDYSVAIGNGNTSTDGGTTLGSNNSATGTGALALGHSNVSDSTFSVAIGSGNYSRGYNAFAIGEGVYAEAANSVVLGTNNITSTDYNRTDWVETDPLFVIGNGGGGSQSNALFIAKNGNTTITGNLYVTGSISSYSGTGDNLGNHILSQNLRTNGYYISNDGGNEGIWVNTNGDTYVYGNQNVSLRGEVWSSTDATGTTGTGAFEVANSLRLDGDEIITNTGTTLLINDDNSSNVRVDGGTLFVDATNNRIGINNTSPSYGLDVTGTMNVSSSGRFGGDVTLSSASPAFYFTDTSTGEDDFKFEANADALVVSTQGKLPTVVLGLGSGGAVAMPNIGTGTGTALVWNSSLGQILRSSSSRKYKTNIFSLTDYSWLSRLNPVEFIYKSDPEKQKQYGLIAEDVVDVNKDLVFYKDGEPDAVNYNALIAPLIKAYQDQQNTINTLKEENADIKKRLEKLEAIVYGNNK